MGVAGGSGSQGGTLLGLVPLPALAEIEAKPEFEPLEIKKTNSTKFG
jgi:hypothetical protein